MDLDSPNWIPIPDPESSAIIPAGVFSFRRRSRVLSKLLNFTCFPQAIKPLDEHIFRPLISLRSHRIDGHFRHDDAAFQELCKFSVEHCVRMPSNDERVIYAPKSL